MFWLNNVKESYLVSSCAWQKLLARLPQELTHLCWRGSRTCHYSNKFHFSCARQTNLFVFNIIFQIHEQSTTPPYISVFSKNVVPRHYEGSYRRWFGQPCFWKTQEVQIWVNGQFFKLFAFWCNASSVQVSPKQTFRFCVWIPDDFGMIDSLKETEVAVFCQSLASESPIVWQSHWASL